MKVINMMNFVRLKDQRMENSEEILYRCTERQLSLCNEFGIDNTFLLQYDALTDRRYQELFRSQATDRTELGLWYELPRPLVEKVGLPWRGRPDWDWDWHVIPGFSMAYTPAERELLADETMRAFREVWGYYPKTVASWLLDSHTVNYLADRYDIHAFAICRDQTNTDAYTLKGGYFNGGYYPARKNLFCPAQTAEERVNVPVFRLLGPDPIHNLDNAKYLYSDTAKIVKRGQSYHGCYTLEAVWQTGYTPEIVDWFYKTYYKNEDMGFSYAQIGQENSFGRTDLIPAMRMQLEKLRSYPDVKILKMSDTGDLFRKCFPNRTPATSLCALDDWNRGGEVQSVWYDCQNYTANLFREGKRIFLRCYYRFDERIPEPYLTEPCKTWDATYENVPVIDTLGGDEPLMIDENGSPFYAVSPAKGVLRVTWGKHSVVFDENAIHY